MPGWSHMTLKSGLLEPTEIWTSSIFSKTRKAIFECFRRMTVGNHNEEDVGSMSENSIRFRCERLRDGTFARVRTRKEPALVGPGFVHSVLSGVAVVNASFAGNPFFYENCVRITITKAQQALDFSAFLASSDLTRDHPTVCLRTARTIKDPWSPVFSAEPAVVRTNLLLPIDCSLGFFEFESSGVRALIDDTLFLLKRGVTFTECDRPERDGEDVIFRFSDRKNISCMFSYFPCELVSTSLEKVIEAWMALFASKERDRGIIPSECEVTYKKEIESTIIQASVVSPDSATGAPTT